MKQSIILLTSLIFLCSFQLKEKSNHFQDSKKYKVYLNRNGEPTFSIEKNGIEILINKKASIVQLNTLASGDVKYDGNRIKKIGQVEIKYNGNQILSIGEITIKNNGNKVLQIDDIKIQALLSTGSINSIDGDKVMYDSKEQVIEIGNAKITYVSNVVSKITNPDNTINLTF